MARAPSRSRSARRRRARPLSRRLLSKSLSYRWRSSISRASGGFPPPCLPCCWLSSLRWRCKHSGIARNDRIAPPPSMDRALLLAGRGLRAFGFGFAAVLIGVHLEHLGLSHAAGGLAAALASAFGSTRAFFLLYAAIGVITAGLPVLMSTRIESERREPAFGALRRPEVRRLLAGLAALFALDSFAGGFVTNSVISYWLHVRFGAGPALLGPTFAVIALLQAVSYEVSGRLSGRIRLTNTMVFTHLPSNLLLLLVAFSPSLGWAVGFLFARFLLSQMDVPARQAYVVSIVPPADRAAAVAVTGAARGVAQAFGPPIAGIAIGAAAFAVPFYAGGGLKIIYDVALYAAFRSRRAGHES